MILMSKHAAQNAFLAIGMTFVIITGGIDLSVGSIVGLCGMVAGGLILHGIDFKARQHRFQTKDVDFFLAPQFLITVHHGASRSIEKLTAICERNNQLLGEGTAALMHRIIDTMVDNYRPEIDQLQKRLDALETDEPFRYLRFRHPPYDDEALERIAMEVGSQLMQGCDVYAYFRHEDAPTAPDYASRLEKLLRT